MAVVFSITLFGFASASFGDLIRWNNPASGIFSAGANWFGGIAPGTDDTAIIDVQDVNEPDYTVTVDTPTTVGGLNVSTLTGGLRIPNVTFNVTGAATLSTGPVRAVNSNTTFGSLTNATDLILQASDGSNTFSVNGTASNTNNLLFRVDRVASGSFLQTTANFNGGLTNSNTIAFETSGGGSAFGTLDVSGVFENNSQIVNRSTAGFQIGADTFNNNGSITSLHDEFVSFSRSGGAINNAGTISARMNAGFLSNFHNQNTGVVDSSYMQLNAGGLGSTFTNDGSINMTSGSGSFNTSSFETVLNRSTIAADSISMIAGFGSSTLINEGAISSTTNTVITAGTFNPKSGSTLSGGGTLTLTGNVNMEAGFAPGFSNVIYGPGAGSVVATVSGAGVLEAHDITMNQWVTFDPGTSLDFSGTAIFRATNSISSSNRLTLNAPLAIDAGERFRVQAINGFSGANFQQGLTNYGELWIETTKQFSSRNTSLTVTVGQGLTNHGTIVGRTRSGLPSNLRRLFVRNVLDNIGEIVNNDSGTALEIAMSGGVVNNSGVANATGGDLLFSFVSTFTNSGLIHIEAGRTVTVTSNTSTFVNDINGLISGHGSLITQGPFIDNGTISPGSSPGILTIDSPNYMQGMDGVIELEIFGLTPGTQHDQLIINSPNAVLEGTLRLIFQEEFLPEQGQVFDLIVGDATTNFHTVELVNLANGFMYDLAANDGMLSITALNDARFVVPEPSTIALFGLSLVGLIAMRRTRN